MKYFKLLASEFISFMKLCKTRITIRSSRIIFIRFAIRFSIMKIVAKNVGYTSCICIADTANGMEMENTCWNFPLHTFRWFKEILRSNEAAKRHWLTSIRDTRRGTHDSCSCTWLVKCIRMYFNLETEIQNRSVNVRVL